MKYTIEYLKENPEIAIHVTTQEELKTVVDMLCNNPEESDYILTYKENHCIYSNMEYSLLGYAKRKKFTIITYETFMNDNFMIPDKWHIAVKSQEEFDIFLKWAVDNNYIANCHLDAKAYTNPYYCFFNKCIKKASYNRTVLKTKRKYSKITVEQFKQYILKENNMIDKINDEFIVDCTNNTTEERQLVYKFLVNNRKYSPNYLHNDYPMIVCNKNPRDSNFCTLNGAKTCFPNHPVYTFEQFKEKYLNNMENKEIIGYKLNGKVSAEKVATLLGCDKSEYQGMFFHEGSLGGRFFNKAQELGILDLWFTPVYKEKEVIIDMNGQFKLTVKEGKIYHKTEDITGYVKEIINWSKNIPSKMDSYAFILNVGDIKLTKTGCESKETYLKDWLNLEQYIK